MMEFIEQLGPAKYYIIGVIGFCIIFYIGIFIVQKQKRKNTGKWLEKNPTACKVYIKNQIGAIRQGTLTIHSVDGDYPVTFTDGMKTGFYLLPGIRVVESSYTTVRPGIMHKQVSTTYGPSKQKVETVAGNTYQYMYDVDDGYSFEEID